MAEPALLDPYPFDLRHYSPEIFDPDLPLAGDLAAGDFTAGEDLDFDLGVDFSIDDFLLRSPDRDSGGDSAAGSGPSTSAQSHDSGACSAASAVTNRDVKHEETEEGRSAEPSLKRKKTRDDEELGNPDATLDASKCRRSDGESWPSASRVAAEDGEGEADDKRRVARLMRNRESAQLSRQRKKRYVEELEEKVKSMHSVINDLNSKISFVMAENATLRQQLGSGSGNGALPATPRVYPPLPGVHFPWVPGYTMRPNGSHVPLVPIPRLKPQQVAPAPKTAKKPECKKAAEGKTKAKTKKVASVSLLGLLFLIFVFGAVVPRLNTNFGMSRDISAVFKNFGQSRGRVLSVTGHNSGCLNNSDVIGVDCSGKLGNSDGGGQKCRPALNSSETLPALLYVPRNGKHVKINGNLIIHSVLASEKAVAHRASTDKGVQSSGKDGKETSLAVAHYVLPSGKDMDRHKSSLADGPLPQWFREGMAGPILSSGMCTEVFQFDISAASAHPGGIIPSAPVANSSVNSTEKHATQTHDGKFRNRRIMYNEAIPLTGKTINNTEPFNKTSESSKLPDNKPATSVVVSVLADPRESGDGDGDARISSKSLSRIFVVVLLDGVKYVTYSCMLPFKSSAPHLVN